MKPKTQKALAQYAADTGVLIDAINPEVSPVDDLASNTPVLVVPEAAVKGCKHEDIVGNTSTPSVEVCRGCGCWREWTTTLGRFTHWQRPCILRAGRQR